MPAANIKEFRSIVRGALEENGFVPKRLEPKMRLAWALPVDEVVPFFFPHEIRRPWGYNLSGTVAVELRPLTAWLEKYPREDRGIFRFFFVSYHIANDALLNGFQVTHGEEVPIEDWIGSVKDRLLRLPSSVDSLIRTYRRSPEDLGWFASPVNKPAWDFLRRWDTDRNASLPIPLRLF